MNGAVSDIDDLQDMVANGSFKTVLGTNYLTALKYYNDNVVPKFGACYRSDWCSMNDANSVKLAFESQIQVLKNEYDRIELEKKLLAETKVEKKAETEKTVENVKKSFNAVIPVAIISVLGLGVVAYLKD